ncbi:MAG: hypothetical protein EBS60_05790 [Verrucomicrobia bacterium]|nr:hypothetical protein [Verrucomicrobiota bacterium]
MALWGSRVQIPAARFSETWEIFFGLKRFAKMRGFGGFSVRGEFAVRRREADEDFFSFCCESLAERAKEKLPRSEASAKRGFRIDAFR